MKRPLEAGGNRCRYLQLDIMQKESQKKDASIKYLPLDLGEPYRRGGRKIVRTRREGDAIPRKQVPLNQYELSLYKIAETEVVSIESTWVFTKASTHKSFSLVFFGDFRMWGVVL